MGLRERVSGRPAVALDRRVGFLPGTVANPHTVELVTSWGRCYLPSSNPTLVRLDSPWVVGVRRTSGGRLGPGSADGKPMAG